MNKSLQKSLNFALLLAIAAAVSFWFLQLSSPRNTSEELQPVPAGDASPRTQPIDMRAVSGLFGAGLSAPTIRVHVAGVIAQGGKNQDVALLSVDERPAMAYKAGETLGGNAILKHVRADGVVIDQNGALSEVLLPARDPPSGIEPVRSRRD